MAFSEIIWDYNGTVLDDLDISIVSMNTLLERRSMPLLAGRKEYLAKFGFPVIDYYKKCGFEFSAESFDAVAEEFISVYYRNMESALPKEGIVPLMEKLCGLGIEQYIVSAAETGWIKRNAQKLGIIKYIKGVVGDDGILAHGKTEYAKRWLDGRKVDPEKCLYIGDTLHDAQTAAALGTGCVLVSYGHCLKSKLLATGYPVVDSTESLTEFVLDNIVKNSRH